MADPDKIEAPEAEVVATPPRLLPVHAAPVVGGKSKMGTTLQVKRGPGRPRKVESMPTTSDLQYHAVISAEKEQYIERDPVVAAVTDRFDSASLFRVLRQEIAKESAALGFQIQENAKYGKDTAQLSSRRIEALQKVAAMEMEIRKLGVETINVRGEPMQKVLGLWLTAIREAAVEVMPPHLLDLFFNKLQTRLADWQDQADDALR